MSDFFKLSCVWDGEPPTSFPLDGELVKISKTDHKFRVDLTFRNVIEETMTTEGPFFFRKTNSVLSLVRLVIKTFLNHCHPEWIDNFNYKISGSSFALDYIPTRELCFPPEFGVEAGASEEVRHQAHATYMKELNPVVNQLVENLLLLVQDFVCILDDSS